MNTTRYRVICKECKSSETVLIDKANTIFWEKADRIISGRYRLDMQWGWQCLCGNNDLETAQERREIKNLQSPDPNDIAKVLKSLKADTPKFKMEKM